MSMVSSYLSVITLNLNILGFSIKTEFYMNDKVKHDKDDYKKLTLTLRSYIS